MRKMKKHIARIIFLFLFFSVKFISAQDNPLLIHVAVLPPYSTQVADYFTSAHQTVVTITNPTGTDYSIFLAGSLKNISTDQGVTIANDHIPSVPPLVVPTGIHVLNGNDLMPYINPTGVDIQGLSEADIANGNLPEGEYQLCLQAYDYNTLEIRSQHEPHGCSNIFTIQFVQPPILNSPICDQEIPYSPVQNILFTWLQVLPIQNFQVGLTSFNFRLVEVPPGMTPIHAMQSTTIPVVQENTLFNFFLYSTLMPALIPGREYAWRVTVSDVTNKILFSNNGESEICTFRYGLPDPSLFPVTSTLTYPAPNARIPFKEVPIIVKFDPVDSDYRNITTSTNILGNQGVHDNVMTHTEWPQGPDEYMQERLGGMPTLEQIQHIQVGRNLNTESGTASFIGGETYTAHTDIAFGLSNGQEKYAIGTSSFSHGMNKPIITQPRLDTAYVDQNVILFQFNTGDSIATLPGQMGIIPPAEIITSLKGNSPMLFKAQVKERYRLEISKSATFDSVLTAHSGVFTMEENITATTDPNQLRNKIYNRTIQKEIYVADTGQYYWRVHWLKDFANGESEAYETSDIHPFKILPLLNPADQIQGACVAECQAPEIVNKTPSTEIAIGDTVRVGLFKMAVETITYNPTGPLASGTGLISIPFMNTVLKVQFTNVLINAERELYQGDVAARHEVQGLIPNIPGLGKLRIDPTNMQQLKDYVMDSHYKSILDPTIPMGLPLGLDKVIEGERYVVAIVGMNFNPQRASLAAAISMPLSFLLTRTSDGKMQQFGLGATDICFHPDGLGGLGVASLYLADPVEFDYAPGQYVHFKSSEIDPATGMLSQKGTYVSFDCEGFRMLRVEGEITFDRTLLLKVNELGDTTAIGNVAARFGFDARRSGNWIARLDFDPFRVVGLDDWNFVVQEATLDFSDLDNPESMMFPQNYVGERSVLWNGFHLRKLTVGLPKMFKMRSPERQKQAYEEAMAAIEESMAIIENINNQPPPGEVTINNEEAASEVGENGIPEVDATPVPETVLANRVIFNVNHLLIDRTGISGKLEALRLLELSNGIIGDWAFSLDTLNIEVVSNSFRQGNFTGEIKTPLTPVNFKYNSVLSQSQDNGLNYSFIVLPKDTIAVPIWQADMTLLPTSRFTINVDFDAESGKKFVPELVLNGSIDVVGKVGEIPLRFAGVKFQELKLNTMEPYLTCQNFTFSSPQKMMAGFPVSVSNIALTSQDYHGLFSWDDTEGSRLALQFTVAVNFMGEANTFGGSTTLAILGRFDPGDLMALASGEIDDDTEFPSLKITGIDLKSILIQGDLGFVQLEGFISFYAEDPEYGTGFIGGIAATFIKAIKVSVIGGFGEVNNMRYWYVDAMAMFNPGIPMGIAPYQLPLDIYGFGGGAFYKMRLADPPPPAGQMTNQSPDGIPPPGSTLSNARLVPDPEAFFGLKATVIIGNTGGGQAFNADLTLTVVINNDGGIGQIAFDGNGYFMTPVMERSFTAVSASVLIQMDFDKQILTGNFSVMIDVPQVLQGRLANNVAGNAYLYVAKKKWQLLVGQPTPNDARIGIRMVNSFDASGYLMAGTNLPAPPPPPQQVNQILGPNTIKRSPAIANGTGFAFGASFTPPTIDESYLAFNARLDASVGFDLNMFNYGASRCDGMAPGQQMGINGWYANGQIWGYFTGSIGITVSLWDPPTKHKILDVQAAALLQAGFPNPAWMTGTIGGNYNILGGLIQGNCQYKISIGNSCTPAPESPLASMKIIAGLSPSASETGVDCGISANAVFNVDVNKEFTVPEMKSDGSVLNRRFRFVIDEFSLKRGNNTVAVTRSTALDGEQSMILPGALLTPFASHTVKITVKVEERINNVWQPARRNNNTLIQETLSQSFTTGALPNRIDDSHVAYSYPFNKQRYYPRNQSANGVINLKQDMPHLFNGQPAFNHTRVYRAIVEPVSGGTKLEKPASYNSANKRISYEMPTLQSNTIYMVRIIHRDNLSNTMANTNLGNGVQAISNAGFQSFTSQLTSLHGNNVQVRNRQLAEGSTLAQNEHLIYEYYFSTGQHATLNDKINSFTVTGTQRELLGSEESLFLDMTGSEKMEVYEFDGYPYAIGYNQLKVQILKVEDAYSNTWHTAYLQPVIYDLNTRIKNNGYSTIQISRPQPDNIGIPPKLVERTTSYDQPITYPPVEITQGVGGSSLEIVAPTTNYTAGVPVLAGASSIPVRMIMRTSSYANADYNKVKEMIAQMKLGSRFGPGLNKTYGGKTVDATTKSKIATFSTSGNGSFSYMLGLTSFLPGQGVVNSNNGKYNVRFTTYNPPGTAGSTTNPSITKEFTYSVPLVMTFSIFTTQ